MNSSPLGRFWMATQTAWGAFWDTLSDPAAGAALSPLADVYRLRWAYYANTLFERSVTTVAADLGLYRDTRPLYNPTKRAVDLVTGAIYPGVLSEDGAALPDAIPLAIPLAQDTPPALRVAIAQLWQWTNMQSLKTKLVRWCAVEGDTLVEINDDSARGKVYYDLIWPGDVRTLSLDGQGNVKAYTLEYTYYDEDTRRLVRYRKEVDKAMTRTYRDEEPFGYAGRPAAYPNPYGFVPAVWFRHLDLGTERGGPLLYGSLNKIPRLMALAAHVHDQVHKQVENPRVLWTDGSLTPLAGTKAKRADGDSTLELDRESVLLLKGSGAGRVESLVGQIDLPGALALIQDLQREIEQDQPILRMYDQLRAMSQVTGPAAERLVGDAAALIYDAQAQYDRGLIALFQMGTAIAGWRLAGRADGWATPTRQQAKFAPYNLHSYARGDLDFAILPRPILPPSALERQQTATAGYTAIKAARDAGVPLEIALADAGWAPEKVQRALRLNAAHAPALPAPPTPPQLPQPQEQPA